MAARIDNSRDPPTASDRVVYLDVYLQSTG